ncbi:hypothetical protein WMY93_025717 [Mugilogobius chulae]|uniref:USP domain-containing protein n=1 Tax=Mugilogobius chulae TaxID=88201 RepID=A0AAW0MVG7_9GOBI
MSARFLCRYFYSGVRGLTNYCLSCCVNTLLQTLFATWELVDLLKRWDRAHVRPDGGCNVPLELTKFLVAMQSGEEVSHKNFLHCLDRNGVQRFLFILNLIQKQMDDKTLAEQIQALYKISLETHVQCLECDFVQTKDSYLLSLPSARERGTLHITGSFFEEQVLRGMNCFFCVQCETKTPSKQGVRLLSLPPILCIQLKRYRSNGGFTRKLGYQVTFPETFNLQTTVPQAFSMDFARANCTYTLYAVVRDSELVHADDSHTYKVSWEECSHLMEENTDTQRTC